MGTLLGLLSVFFTSSMPVINKFILHSTTPIQGALANALFSGLFFYLICIFTTKNIRVFINKTSFLAGTFNGLGLVFLFLAVERINPVAMGFIGRLGVVFAMILSSVFLKQRPDKIEIVLAMVAVLGALGSALFDSSQSSSSNIGVLFAIGYVLLFTSSNMMLRKASDSLTNSQLLTATNFISFAVILIAFLFSAEKVRLPNETNAWLLIIVGALLGSCMGIWLFVQSQKHISFSRASLLRTTGPLFTAIIAFPFFGMNFNAVQVFSAALLMFSVVILAVREKKVSVQK